MKTLVGIWIIGWAITLFSVIGAEIVQSTWEYVVVGVTLLVAWPAVLGMTLGEIWFVVQ